MILDHPAPTGTSEILEDIRRVGEDFGLSSLNRTLRSIRSFAAQNQYLDVAVLGQFKTGKSSFLNSFINRPLLPVGNIPVTSVITRIKYGTEERAIVYFVDHSTREIPVDDIAQYVSESGNPENTKNVLLVEIETPALDRVRNLRLVDTPGIGSVWRHNTETTSGWFPETGGVLLLISAEKPISETELELLREIYLYSPEITLVLTKTDLFPEEKLQEVESFTREVLKKAFDSEFPVIRYSAWENASRHNEEIEERCLSPLALNRDEAYARILRHKIRALGESCLSYLDISYQASLKEDAERNTLKEIILDRQLNAHYIRRELVLIIGSYKGKTRESVLAYLNRFRDDIENRLTADYEASFDRWNGNLYSVSRRFEEWQRESLEAELKAVLLREEKSFELLTAVKKHLSFYVKSFRERLSDNLLRLLGVSMNSEQWEITLGEFRRPSISVGRSFEFHLDMLWFLFPMFLYRRVFRHYFLGKIPLEVEKNLHRLTSDLTEQINRRMDDLMKQALAYMQEELDVVETLLLKNQGNSSEIKKRMEELGGKLAPM